MNSTWKIYLKKAKNELAAVILTGEKNARKKNFEAHISKEQILRWRSLFIKFFVGSGKASNKTKIKNPEDFRFRYDSTTHVVSIMSEKPIQIENDYLKYHISYSLDTSQIEFRYVEQLDMLVPRAFSVAGKMFFKDLLDLHKKNRRFHRRREKAYYGSVLHFMRALKKDQLTEAGFQVEEIEKFTDAGEEKRRFVPALFERQERRQFTEILPPAEFYIRYKKEVTRVIAEQNFGIDAFGNFFPWNALTFHGAMGKSGVSSALPLNYSPLKK